MRKLKLKEFQLSQVRLIVIVYPPSTPDNISLYSPIFSSGINSISLTTTLSS
jgi:hypothetical protein